MIIPVKTNASNYEVHLGENILEDFSKRNKKTLENYDQLIMISDENVWNLHESYVRKNFTAPFNLFLVPSGESCKTFESYFNVQSFLLQSGAFRKSAIFALGGGAVGDLTGFVAATFMRGIDFYQIPTTILAHDSSVGGKTAINHPLGKNMIGAFYQPQEVIYDVHFLKSLPLSEVKSGMAEVIKHSLISDSEWVEEFFQITSLSNLEKDQLLQWINKGIRVKAKIVEMDEKESNFRKYLNFGHTYGHAVEAAIGYGKISHGEAVMIGMIPALLLSEKYGQLPKGFAKRFYSLANRLEYNFEQILDCPFEQLAAYMQKDKKTINKQLHFALLETIGKPFIQVVPVDAVRLCDEELRQWIREGK